VKTAIAAHDRYDRRRYVSIWTGEVFEGATPREARLAWTKHLLSIDKIYGVKK
jgi:hypothetical protein